MDAVQDILRSLPLDQLATELGTDRSTAQQLASQVIPALIGGMSANADDAAGARSLATALDDHANSDLLRGGVDLHQVDTADGEAIVHNVFGGQTNEVTRALGQGVSGANSELVQKVLKLLAPIVLAYIAGQLTQGRGGSAGSSGGGLSDILLDMLGGAMGGGAGGGAATQQAPRQQPPAQPADPGSDRQSSGRILGDLLGGLLGGGRRS